MVRIYACSRYLDFLVSLRRLDNGGLYLTAVRAGTCTPRARRAFEYIARLRAEKGICKRLTFYIYRIFSGHSLCRSLPNLPAGRRDYLAISCHCVYNPSTSFTASYRTAHQTGSTWLPKGYSSLHRRGFHAAAPRSLSTPPETSCPPAASHPTPWSLSVPPGRRSLAASVSS